MRYENVVAAVIAFGISALLGFVLIPFLRRLKFGQTILEEGPSWHKSKQGTPTMGGLLFIPAVVLAVFCGWFLIPEGEQAYGISDSLGTVHVFAGLAFALLMGLMGFLDDYIKVVQKRNLGLRAWQKIAFQLVGSVGYLLILYLSGNHTTSLWFPFIGTLDLGWFYYPFSVFMIIGFVNAVNLTDGIDGLCASVTFVYSMAFTLISSLVSIRCMGLPAMATAAGCLGYLIWNFHPAKVFMGDTGSMFLGGMVVAMAYGCGTPVLLLLCGVIYFCEAMSDIIQIGYFKLTHGKRVFRMAPIHHHFEMGGWSENKIVGIFSLVTGIGCLVGIVAVFFALYTFI